MRLSDFILDQLEPILEEWEAFARTIEPPALTMDREALRDHASYMLKAIAIDLGNAQTSFEQAEKAKGRGARLLKEDTAAEIHAAARLQSGYTINQLVSEYRALRASVLQLWSKSAKTVPVRDLVDITRFNEAIDQALAESVERFAEITGQMAKTERRRLDAVLEAAPVAICMTDINGKLLLANAENRRIWGNHPMSESVAAYGEWKGWWADGSEKHGRQLAAHEWAAARALAGEEAPRDVVEIETFGTSGKRRTILLHGTPVRDGNGNIVGAVVAQMDITSQVQTEAALRNSEAKFRTIANAMPQMVWSTLPDGYHDYYNQQWYDFTGVPEGSTDGEEWNGVFHPDDQPRAWEMWRHSLATGETYEIQYRLRHHSGEYRWTLGRALPVRDESGRITRWMGTCTDIHDQKLAEDSLRESGRRKDEFLAMLAHELRNPLAPISAASQLLRIAGGTDNQMNKISEILSRQVMHMTNLVDDLLDVSRVTRGLVQLEKEDLDLKSIVNNAVEQAQPLIEERNHELHLRIPSSSAHVHGDRTRLIQVIVNLLNNAAKYTPHGGRIALSIAVQKTQAEITVSDNGSGIAPSLLPYVFDLFTQGERTPDRAQGGLGLGLALVKSITALHGGRAKAASEGLGKGSSFTISLPLATKKEIRRTTATHETVAPRSTRPVRLMIVDDNPDAAHSLAAVLAANGHHAQVRENAASALKAVEDDPLQVFILDIGLPDMDGYELARRLRSRPETANALLIALTGYGQAHDRVLSKAAGFDHHCVKPIDTAHLLNLLSQEG